MEIGSSSQRDATVRTRRFAVLLGPPTICQMDRSDPIAPRLSCGMKSHAKPRRPRRREVPTRTRRPPCVPLHGRGFLGPPQHPNKTRPLRTSHPTGKPSPHASVSGSGSASVSKTQKEEPAPIPIHLGSLAPSKAVPPGPEGRQMIAQRVSAGFRPTKNTQPRQGRQNPCPHEHRIRLHRSRTPRNTNRISPIHPAEFSRRGAEPLRATGNQERGHP